MDDFPIWLTLKPAERFPGKPTSEKYVHLVSTTNPIIGPPGNSKAPVLISSCLLKYLHTRNIPHYSCAHKRHYHAIG